LCVDEESYNVLLNHGFDRKATAKQRARGGIYDGYASLATNFLQEQIQPAERNSTIHSTCGDARQSFSRGLGKKNLSTVGPKKRCFPNLISGLIQQQTLQPPNLTVFGGSKYDKVSNSNEIKKRSRSSYIRTKTTGELEIESKLELRIEGGTMNHMIDEIRTKAFETSAQESSSVFLKGIRGIPTSYIDLRRGNEIIDSVSLLNSLKYLVKNKGSSWKRVRVQECDPWIVEVLLASPCSTNFEEIHLMGMRDNGLYRMDHNQSISSQVETSSESRLQSISRTADTQTYSSSLIIALLRKTTRIKQLILKDCNLDNLDLNRIMSILCNHPTHPKSLEHLDLRFNKFTPIAIQSVLATHLRLSLHSLKTMKLRQGLQCVVHCNIRDVILQSLRCDRVVLESIDIFDWDKSVEYFLDMNRAKRRFIFCNNDRFPRSLWPRLLEQALVVNEDGDCDALITKTKSQSQLSFVVPRHINTTTTRRQASVVYHIFRNGGPMLLEQRHPNAHCIGLESN